MAPVTHGVPVVRLRRANRGDIVASNDFVLYWMTSARRLADNYGLQYAAGEARRLGRPLVILEALRCDYPWASDRFHRFVLDGMAGHARALARTNAIYHPWVEPGPGSGSGLLETLAARANLVVTDEYPAFFLPRMIEAAAARIGVRVVVADSNGLLPLRAADREFTSAWQFRRFLQRELPAHLDEPPLEDPLRDLPGPCSLPEAVLSRWPASSLAVLEDAKWLGGLPLDHEVGPVGERGGDRAADEALVRFLDRRLERYAQDRNEPGLDGTSGLSPWLHFGHVSVHRVLRELAVRERWSAASLSKRTDGRRNGWWGMSESAESFLDELVTWREIGFNMASRRTDVASYDSLPPWALATLADHEADRRPWLYPLDTLENAATHDPLWNAAQNQLRAEGRIHNYLRMLWGKKILEWTESPRQAADFMIHLNDRWAVDGRDPNSYSGIFWCLGRYDRPWPERPVYGKVRCMTSDSTRRKYEVSGYIDRWAPAG